MTTRITRRRALAGIGMTGAGAAFLAACGGSKSGDKGSQSTSGILSKPQDTSAQAKSGGVLKDYTASPDISSWDVSAARSTIEAGPGAYTYPRILKFTAPKYPDSAVGEVEGDIAESYEFAADKLQLTVKLRQGLKWDDKAPTSGREIDARDVVFTWGRFSRLSAFRGSLAYGDNNPDAPIESVTAPDNRTVVFKLHKPNSVVLQLIAQSQGLLIMPREAEGGFDPKTEVRGYGPYLLESYTPSVSYVWRKNPNYYVKGRPYIDKIEQPLIPQYTTQLSQFRAGNIYTNVVTQINDLLPTKKSLPDLILQQSDMHDLSSDAHIAFGYEGGSQFKDQRVRQALSMLIDRDSYVDVITNRDKFSSDGIPVDVRFPAPIPAGYDGFWLDPKGKDFGPNAKYVNFDMAEAKKLLTAAGFTNGFTTSLFFNVEQTSLYPYGTYTNIFPAMLAAGGINAQLKGLAYNSDFLPNIFQAYVAGNTKGFNGFATRRSRGPATAAQSMYDLAHPGGRAFVGATPDGMNPQNGDPAITDMINKILLEFDLGKQQAIAHDYERLMAQKAYLIQTELSSPMFTLTWPALQNFGAFSSPDGGVAVAEASLQFWIDDTKAPLKKA